MSRGFLNSCTRFRLVFVFLCGAGQLMSGYICQPGTAGPPATNIGPNPGPNQGNTTFSVSTTCSEQVMTTNLTQRVDQFSTELLVRQVGGPLLLDQTFMAPFGDPLVQSALLSARLKSLRKCLERCFRKSCRDVPGNDNFATGSPTRR